MQHAINGLAKKPTLDAFLDEEDRVKLQELNARKNSFAVANQVFAGALKKKLELVAKRLPDKATVSLSDCYRGFDREDTLRKASGLQGVCKSLRGDYDDFRKDIEGKYASKNEAEKRERLLQSLTLISVSVLCIVSVALLFTPASPAAVASLAAPELVITVAALSAAALVSGALGVAVYMKKGEVARAIQFLEDIDGRMKVIKNSIAEVRASTEALTMADRDECLVFVKLLIRECGRVELACQKL